MDAWPDSERSGCLLLPLHHASIDGTFGSGQRIQRTAGPSGSWAKIHPTNRPAGQEWHSMIIDRNFEILTEIWHPKLHIFRRDRFQPPDYIWGLLTSHPDGKPVNHGKPKHNTLTVSRYKMRMKLEEKSVFLYDANNHDPLCTYILYIYICIYIYSIYIYICLDGFTMG